MKVAQIKAQARATVGTMVKKRPDASLVFLYIFAHKSAGVMWEHLRKQGAKQVGGYILTVGDRARVVDAVPEFPADMVAVMLCGSDGQALVPFDPRTGDFVRDEADEALIAAGMQVPE